jgi:hypothetical protein
MATATALLSDAARLRGDIAQLRAELQPRPAPLDLAVWSEERLGFMNPAFVVEWYELAAVSPRLCILAPRDHAKSQCLAINQVAWRSVTQPGHFSFVFSATQDQAGSVLTRICEAVEQADPGLRQRVANKLEASWSNGSRVKVAGAGKSVRGDHPDLIVGDDVLTEEATQTNHTRRKVESWWLGTVAGMAHPSTAIHLVGTPFHARDLLMGLKTSPIYTWRRYQAEFEPHELVPGTYAVEVGRPQTAGTVSTVRPEPVVAPVRQLSANQQARRDELIRQGWLTPAEERELESLRHFATMQVAQPMAEMSNGGR